MGYDVNPVGVQWLKLRGRWIDLYTADAFPALTFWDSLEHINLIGAVEQEFKMRFKMKEVSSMKNVGEMMSIIEERGK